MKTLKQLAQEALDAQNACNLTGVARSFGRAMGDLRSLFPDERTDFYNRHPITLLWLDKLNQLAGIQDLSGATFPTGPIPRAYEEISKILASED